MRNRIIVGEASPGTRRVTETLAKNDNEHRLRERETDRKRLRERGTERKRFRDISFFRGGNKKEKKQVREYE